MNVEIVPENAKGKTARITVQKNIVVPVLQNFLVGIGIVFIGIGVTNVWENAFNPEMYRFVKTGIIATGIFISMRAAWDEFVGIVFYFGEGFGKLYIRLERELYKTQIQRLQNEIAELRASSVVIKKQGIVSNDEDVKDARALLFLHGKSEIGMTRKNAMGPPLNMTRPRWDYMMRVFKMADVPIKNGRLVRMSERDALDKIMDYYKERIKI